MLAVLLFGVAVALFWSAVGQVRDRLLVRVDLSSLCSTAKKSRCFVTQRGIVNAVTIDELRIALDEEPYVERLTAIGGWDEHPAPGARVLLHRWEGGDVAYVTSTEDGQRYGTSDAAGYGLDSVPVALWLIFVGAFVTVFARVAWDDRFESEAP